jgi:hypothetical protein
MIYIMNLNSTVSKLLTNKWVLNIVSILAFLNVIGYMVMGNFNNVVFFMVLAVLVRYFSKNMIIVLSIPLVIVNLFAIGQTNYNVEGMDNRKKEEEESKEPEQDKNLEKAEPVEEDPLVSSNVNDEKSGFEVGRKKNATSKIDYAATIEDAYDDLNKILGSDGIKNLTDDTQRLMKQQMQLAESMKSMAPIMDKMLPMAEKAKEMMTSMDKDGKGMSGILDMAKKMSGNLGTQQKQ